MTTTYDPFHPAYFDEVDVHDEMTHVYDLCHGCRLCFKFCPAFPTLFRFVDEHDMHAERMSPAEQDQVVDECFNCKLCFVNCPYTPGQHEWAIDFPRLMLRAEQVQFRNERHTMKEMLTTQALGRSDLAGKVNTTLAPLVNKAIGTPGNLPRTVMEKVAGIASERMLPPYTRQRFSTWFKKRGDHTEPRAVPAEQGMVALFATCIVEYQAPDIGKDLVKVYERNGVSCSLPDGQQCCGAPWLHSGDVDTFVKQGRKNIKVLAGAVRSGHDIVVPQPTCSYVIKHDYADYIGGPDATLVAEHTYDAAEYLWKLHKGDGTGLDTEFPGGIPAEITYHAPCHLRAQNIGLRSRDLLMLTGAKVTVVAECSAIDGTWGYREANYEASRKVAKKMADALGKATEKAGNDVIAGDCHLANGGIVQETGVLPVHPLQLVARAYGIPEGEPLMPKLTLEDIADLRAYERARPEMLAAVIALKKKRRVAVGERITLVFENTVTITFQIQEMARIEKMVTDEAIEGELEVYNPLIPDQGHLAATLFLELTSDDELDEWLPKLVGIEQEIEFRVGGASSDAAAGSDGDGPFVVRCKVDPDHARFLTRENTTPSVHYIHFAFLPAEVDAFAAGPVRLAITHPNYEACADLHPDTAASLLDDLRNGG